MKYLIISLTFCILTLSIQAQKTSKPSKQKTTNGIHWISFEEAQEKMKQNPKKVFIDIYTDWCGWCKVMDKKTFSNRKVINYINENFYAIHFDAETADSIFFKDKKYGRIEKSKVNALAAELMQNELSYPTTIFFDELFVNPMPLPGYLDVPTIEMMLTYIATNQHKTVRFDKFKKSFKSSW